jgi:hypothetical protein
MRRRIQYVLLSTLNSFALNINNTHMHDMNDALQLWAIDVDTTNEYVVCVCWEL